MRGKLDVFQPCNRRRLRPQKSHMAQVPLAGRGVVGAGGGVKRGAAFGKAPGSHHLGKLRLHAVGGNRQHALGIAPYGLDPTVGRQVVLWVAHAQRRFAKLGAVAGSHALQVGLGKLMHAARIVGMAARAENLDAVRQDGRGRKGCRGRHGPMVASIP